MKQVLGFYSLIGSLISFFSLFYLTFIEPLSGPDGIYISLFGLSLMISSILYLVITRFWTKSPAEIDKINIENEMLKKQIEQKELRRKLEE